MDSQGVDVVIVALVAVSETAMRVLILGGTTEALALAQQLARDGRFAPIYSLAGRTAAPRVPDVKQRIGGFGGVPGLMAWLTAERVQAIVDATHPFAAGMTANAAQAAQRLGLPIVHLQRPAWRREAGDDWTEVAGMNAVPAALGSAPRRVFLAIGRNELGAFRMAPQHRYLVRAVDPPARELLPPHAEVLLHRGPFALEDEVALLRAYAIDVVVSKNSGGAAAGAKIMAARQIGLPVIMVARPPLPEGEVCPDVAGAIAWLETLLSQAHGTVSERGV
jgi:precorrin-6A/cobalt-precorrin-6A reductase